MKARSLARADPLVGLRYAPEGLTLLFGLQSDGEGGVLQNGHTLWGIWGSYYNTPKAIFYLLKGDYIRGLLYGDSCEGPHNVNVFLEGGIYNHAWVYLENHPSSMLHSQRQSTYGNRRSFSNIDNLLDHQGLR